MDYETVYINLIYRLQDIAKLTTLDYVAYSTYVLITIFVIFMTGYKIGRWKR